MFRPAHSDRRNPIHRFRGGLWLGGLLALGLALLVPVPTWAGGVDVTASDSSVFTVEPRQVVTRVFRVTNRGGPGIFESRLILPEGWRALTPDFPFQLAPGASAMRLVSFFAPANTPAGEYRVGYQVAERDNRGRNGGATMLVRVLPVFKLQVDVVELPTVAIVGEPYKAVFQISNYSNAPLAVGWGAESSKGSKLKPASGALTLAPGESVPVTVVVNPPTLTEPAHDQLRLTASAPAQGLSNKAERSVEIMPRISGDQTGHWHELPTMFTQRTGANWRRNSGADGGGSRVGSGNQIEWSGAGTLDPQGQHYLSFLFRGPDLDDASIFGQQSMFFVDYRGPRFDVGLGNLSFDLSPLTVTGTGGIGARLGWHEGDWRAAAFYSHDWNTDDNWDTDDSGQQIGFSVAHALRPNWWVTLSYLNTEDEEDGNSHILSLRNQWQFGEHTALDLELAGSTGDLGTGAAVWLDLSRVGAPFRYRLSLLHADPNFAGQYQDQSRLHFDFSYNPEKQPWSFDGFYRYDRYNQDQQRLVFIDPTRLRDRNQQVLVSEAALFGNRNQLLLITEPAREEQEAGLGVRWGSDAAGRWSAQLRYGECQGQRDNGLPFSDVTHSLRLGWGKSFDKQNLSLDTAVEVGRRFDHVSGGTEMAYGYRGSLSWRPTRFFSLSAAIDDTIDPCLGMSGDSNDSPQFSLGANFNFSSRSALNLGVQAQQSDDATQVIGQAQFSYRRDNGHIISLQAQYASGANEEANVMLSYAVPIKVPTMRKGDTKRLTGRVFDQETRAGLANVVLRLGRQVAITDERGNFTFPAAPWGFYDLSVAGGQVPVGMIPVGTLPVPVDLATESEQHVEIGFIRGGTIAGRVQLYEPDPRLMPSQTFIRIGQGGSATPPPAVKELVPTTGLRGILVEVRNGDKVHRRLTNANGEFSFAGLHPGTWTVSMDPAAIPDTATMDVSSYTVELAPKGEQQLEFRVDQPIRAMRMLAPLKVSG